MRATSARESLRQGFLRAAAAHERAARELERAADRGSGDVLVYRRHTLEHRAYAEADRRQAAECATPQRPPPATGAMPRSARRDLLRRRLTLTARKAGLPASRAVAEAATEMVCGVDAVVITIRGPGLAQHELAATDRWGHEVEELQYTTGEGPSVAATGSGEPVSVTNLIEYARVWPGFVGAAAGYGVGAAFAFPLATGSAVLGTMTLYRRDPGDPPDGLTDARELAELLATALMTAGADELVEQISSSTAYDDINVAVGLLSVQHAISTEESLARLRASAFTAGQPLSEAAREVVARHIHRHQDQRRE
ncbi:ANTAR domain-containing protein [Amycolatopsis sp. H6(2020)]|nr:ANTAR domain-containing protein [Amycolatopsis sp. H6(2020)]